MLATLAFAFDYGQEERLTVPVREQSIIASPEGFYPARISVFVGEKVKFYVTSTTEKPSCFMLSDKGLFLSANKGEISNGEAHFDRPGTFKYHCPTNQITGSITVLERTDKANREIASSRESKDRESKVRLWKPREE